MKCVLILTLLMSQGWPGHCDDRDTYSDPNAFPCLRAPDPGAYKTFLERHLLLEKFDVKQKASWADYLSKRGLCGRTGQAPQSFFQISESVKAIKICNGWSVRQKLNLCRSVERFDISLIQSERMNQSCRVTQITQRRVYVTVACDLVGVVCVPVHYEGQTDYAPDNNGTFCEKRKEF